MKFLLVDDDERMTLLISKKVAQYGASQVAASGEQAIALFRAAQDSGEPFDAVFMDIEMPGMNGHEVVKQMRAIEKESGVDPTRVFKLVMVSGYSDTKNVCKSFFQGYADAYVAKADLKDKLVDELRNIRLIA